MGVPGRSLKDKGTRLVSDEEKERQNEEEFKVVYNAIGQLSEQQQSIVMDYYGLSGHVAKERHEIAKDLGLATSTIERHLTQLKRQLAQQLAQYMVQQAVGPLSE